MTTRPYADTVSLADDWLERRIWPRVNKDGPNGCWLWTGSHSHNGYARSGAAQLHTGTVYVHRALWIATHGPITDEYEVDHTCFTTNCVNLEHLRLLTKAENRRIGRRNDRYRTTHCPQGHEKTGENALVVTRTGRNPYVVCRRCKLEQARGRDALRRAARAAA